MGALLAVRIDCCCKQGQQHDQVGHSSLHFAAATGNLGEVKHFVENLRCDAKQSDSLGKTPLFHAARQGKLDVVRYLIEECRMNANQKDKSGGTVLFEAAAGGNLEVVEYLVESGNVDPIRENHDGYTAHDWAVNEEIADYLQDVIEAKGHTIKRPFDDSFDDMFDEQPLHKAVLAGDLKMVMHIVKSKGRGGVKSAHNNVRKAAVATDRGKRGVGGLSSSIIEQEDDLGRTALFYASDLTMVRYLVEECKADVNHKSSKGETALFDAAGDGNLPIVRFLVEHGDAELCENDKGQTALFFAAGNGNIKVVKYLVENCGADVYKRDFFKARTARDYASGAVARRGKSSSAGGHPEVVRYLGEQMRDGRRSKEMLHCDIDDKEDLEGEVEGHEQQC